MITFDSLGIDENILKALTELEYLEPTEIQQKVIPILLYVGANEIPHAISLKLARDINSIQLYYDCLLYTSPSPRDRTRSRMPSSA